MVQAVRAFCLTCNTEQWPIPDLVLNRDAPACKNCGGRLQGQTRFGEILRRTGQTVKEEVEIDELPGRLFDFATDRILYEFDGDHHFGPTYGNTPAEKKRNFERDRAADLLKTRIALTNRYRVVRVPYRWLCKSDEYKTAFIEFVLNSTNRLIVSDKDQYDWLDDMPYKPFEPDIPEETVDWTEQKIAGYDIDGQIPPITVCPCPAHGGDCLIDEAELERISCQHGCLLHSALIFKSDSSHLDADSQRKWMLERCRHGKVGRPSHHQAEAAPKQPKFLAGTATCPIHANCRIPADWLVFRTCDSGHPRCGSLVFDGFQADHLQRKDYNDRHDKEKFNYRCAAEKNRKVKAKAKADAKINKSKLVIEAATLARTRKAEKLAALMQPINAAATLARTRQAEKLDVLIQSTNEAAAIPSIQSGKAAKRLAKTPKRPADKAADSKQPAKQPKPPIKSAKESKPSAKDVSLKSTEPIHPAAYEVFDAAMAEIEELLKL
jgi:hypothetical protein